MPQLNPLFAQFEFLSCDNTQLLLWLDLGTKNTWLGLGKGSIMDWNTCFGCNIALKNV